MIYDATELRATATRATDTHVGSIGTKSERFTGPASAARTTVLPKVEGDGTRIELSLESRSRYEPTKLLGAGGMGEVILVKDLDIERRVAMKRLLPDMNDPSTLARFVDEIRTVGRLEHPNIVPIHDVGVDELGRYFFVMKLIEGETLEQIIDKLTAGDPAYTEKYSIEARIQIVIGILHALEYAHSQGIVHRDIKPANIMIGRYGEVVLMDWGIARPIGAARDAASMTNAAIGDEDERARMYATRVGSLIGTPAYMSPEQARGDNNRLDARSDLYSVAVLIHELMGLKHYLDNETRLEGLMTSIERRQFGIGELIKMKYPRGMPPAELLHLSAKGLAKEPASRFQSARELIDALGDILEGKVAIQCHVTFTKRLYRELGRLVDRSPLLGISAMTGTAAAVVFAGVELARMVIA